MKLTSLKIKHRIALLTLFAITSFVISLLINKQSVQQNAERLNGLQSQLYPVLELATQNEGLLLQLDQHIQTAVTTGEEDSLETVDAIVVNINNNLTKVAALASEQAQEISQIKTELALYHKNAKSLVAEFLKDDVDFDSIKRQAADNAERYNQLVVQFQQKKQLFSEQFKTSIENTLASSESAGTSMLIIGLVASIILIVAGLLVNSSIILTLNNVTDSLRNISEGEGDLSARIHYDGKDEIATLVHWFNQFVSKLQVSIAETKSTTESLSLVSQSLLSSS
ncbi:HAMP domain-containing protein, partial [Shewanella sp.]